MCWEHAARFIIHLVALMLLLTTLFSEAVEEPAVTPTLNTLRRVWSPVFSEADELPLICELESWCTFCCSASPPYSSISCHVFWLVMLFQNINCVRTGGNVAQRDDPSNKRYPCVRRSLLLLHLHYFCACKCPLNSGKGICEWHGIFPSGAWSGSHLCTALRNYELALVNEHHQQQQQHPQPKPWFLVRAAENS